MRPILSLFARFNFPILFLQFSANFSAVTLKIRQYANATLLWQLFFSSSLHAQNSLLYFTFCDCPFILLPIRPFFPGVMGYHNFSFLSEAKKSGGKYYSGSSLAQNFLIWGHPPTLLHLFLHSMPCLINYWLGLCASNFIHICLPLQFLHACADTYTLRKCQCRQQSLSLIFCINNPCQKIMARLLSSSPAGSITVYSILLILFPIFPYHFFGMAFPINISLENAFTFSFTKI